MLLNEILNPFTNSPLYVKKEGLRNCDPMANISSPTCTVWTDPSISIMKKLCINPLGKQILRNDPHKNSLDCKNADKELWFVQWYKVFNDRSPKVDEIGGGPGFIQLCYVRSAEASDSRSESEELAPSVWCWRGTCLGTQPPTRKPIKIQNANSNL